MKFIGYAQIYFQYLSQLRHNLVIFKIKAKFAHSTKTHGPVPEGGVEKKASFCGNVQKLTYFLIIFQEQSIYDKKNSPKVLQTGTPLCMRNYNFAQNSVKYFSEHFFPLSICSNNTISLRK